MTIGTRGPNIPGTNVPTEIVAERFHAGESIEELAADYWLDPSLIEQAIRLEATGPQWTQELPTEPGWYWHSTDGHQPEIVRLSRFLGGLYANDTYEESGDRIGPGGPGRYRIEHAWWLGPLDEPAPPEVKP